MCATPVMVAAVEDTKNIAAASGAVGDLADVWR
jgi:hypothetical protein